MRIYSEKAGQDEETQALVFSRNEVEMVIGALRETLELVEDWEFETRMGFKRSEVERLLSELAALDHLG